MAFFSNLKITNCGQKGRIVVASRAFVYTNAIFALQNACWAVPNPFLFCIVPMQAARFFKTLSVKEKSCIPRKSPEQVQQVKTSLSMTCKNVGGIGRDVPLYGNCFNMNVFMI